MTERHGEWAEVLERRDKVLEGYYGHLKPILEDLVSRGLSASEMAKELNAMGRVTPYGRPWTLQTARNALERCGLKTLRGQQRAAAIWGMIDDE